MVNILQAGLSIILYLLAYIYLQWLAVGEIFIGATTIFSIYFLELIRIWWNSPPAPKKDEKPLTEEELRQAWKDIGRNPTIKSKPKQNIAESQKSSEVDTPKESDTSSTNRQDIPPTHRQRPPPQPQKPFLELVRDFWDEQLRGDLAFVFHMLQWCFKNAFTLLNIAAYVFMLDYTFRPVYFHHAASLAFTRVGFVSDSSAKIFFRYPFASPGGIPNYNVTFRIEYRPDDSNNFDPDAGKGWIRGSLITIVPNDDFTGVSLLEGLQPSTEYEYKFVLPDSGEAVKVTVELGIEKMGYIKFATRRFHTLPPQGKPVKFRFASGSCIKPNFPYMGFTWSGIKGFRTLSRQRFDLLLFLGDFIYSDVPFNFGTTVNDYRRQYRQVYSEPDYKRIYESVASLHVYDDHEILDNWNSQNEDPMPAAMQAFNEYQGRVNPDPLEPNSAYYEFTYGDTAFFFLDTRRYRTTQAVPVSQKTMLGQTQKQHLFRWLERVNHTAAFKFVITSVPFTRNVEHHSVDAWPGFLEERAELLYQFAFVQGLVIISGDTHEAAVTQFPVPSAPYTPIEFSVSPVNQFWLPWSPFHEFTDTDRSLFYKKEGQIKYALFIVDTVADKPKLKAGVFVGEERTPLWETEILGEKIDQS